MKFLIIEDDANIVEAMTIAFRMHWPGAEILSTGSGEQGIELAKRSAIDVIILDLNLTDISGFDVLTRIRAFSNTPIFILTVTTDEPSIIKGLELGADDYIVKPIGELHLISRIRAHLRRSLITGGEALVIGRLRIEQSTARAFCDNVEINVTPTEYRILLCLMQNQGRLVSNKSLVKAIWNVDYDGATNAIKVYVQRLRKKIEPDPHDPKIIITRPGMGHCIAIN